MTNELVSPYAAAKIVNKWLETDGINKKLPPQMMYGYVKKNYIVSVEMPEGSKCNRMVTTDALKTWYDAYTKKTTEVETTEVQEDESAGFENIEVDGVPIDDEQTVLFM